MLIRATILSLAIASCAWFATAQEQPLPGSPVKALPAPPTPEAKPGDPQPTDAPPTEKPADEKDGTIPAPPDATLKTPGAKPVVTPPVPAATNDKPGHEYFTRAAEILKKAKAITYHVSFKGTGGMEAYSSTVQADVKMLRDPSAGGPTNGWFVRSTGSGTPKPGADSINFDVAWMGNPVEYVSHTEKKVFERRNARELKSPPAFQVAGSARLLELYAAKPFTKELAPAADYTVELQETISGVLCDVLTVSFGEKKGKVKWAFATTDHFPRRYESIIENTIMSGSSITVLDSVVIDDSSTPKLTKALLRVEVPEGYTQDRPAKPPVPVPPPAAQPPAATPDDADKLKGDQKGDHKAEAMPTALPIANPNDPSLNTVKSALSPTTITPPSAATPPPLSSPEASTHSQPEPLTHGPAFDLPASSGGTLSLASLANNAVVIEFGGSWCLPQRSSHDELDALVTAYKDKPVKVVSLSVRDKSTEAALDRFKAKNHFFPLLVDADATAAAYQVRAFPSFYILGFDGEIVKIEPSYTKEATIADIKQTLDEYLSRRAGIPIPAKAEAPKVSPDL